jgi:hypothetical protein
VSRGGLFQFRHLDRSAQRGAERSSLDDLPVFSGVKVCALRACGASADTAEVFVRPPTPALWRKEIQETQNVYRQGRVEERSIHTPI